MATENVTFDFKYIDDVHKILKRLSTPNRGDRLQIGHVYPFFDYADSTQISQKQTTTTTTTGTITSSTSVIANETQKQLCYDLAKGYNDILVILPECTSHDDPSLSLADHLQHKKSYALQYLDWVLKFAFKGKRSIHNTIVLDIRPFRPKSQRDKESDEVKAKNDRIAYTAFAKSLSNPMLRPKVVIVCKGDDIGPQTGALDGFYPSTTTTTGGSSKIDDTAGCIRNWTMPHGHETTIIDCFHPRYFYRQPRFSMERDIRQRLFEACFVVAANLVAGRTVGGKGVDDLRVRNKTCRAYRPKPTPSQVRRAVKARREMEEKARVAAAAAAAVNSSVAVTAVTAVTAVASLSTTTPVVKNPLVQAVVDRSNRPKLRVVTSVDDLRKAARASREMEEILKHAASADVVVESRRQLKDISKRVYNLAITELEKPPQIMCA